MAKKEKSSPVWAVRTSEAVRSLERWLITLDQETYQQGEDDFADGCVAEIAAGADHFVEGTVSADDLYEVTLFLTRGKWTSACTCSKKKDCAHVAAAGLMWVASRGEDYTSPDEYDDDDDDDFEVVPPPLPKPAPVIRAGRPPAVPVEETENFAAKWGPVIAKKLGRKLAPAEIRRLTQLSDLFREYTRSFNHLYAASLERYDFAEVIPPDAQRWAPLLDGWWNHQSAPADPWALWQYMAYSLQLRGQAIPEVFLPLTNTARVHASLEGYFLHQHLEAWHAALATPGPAHPDDQIGSLREGVAGPRARVDVTGKIFIEFQSAPNGPWKPAPQRWLQALARAESADFAALAPAAAALAMSLAVTFRKGARVSFKDPLSPAAAEAVLSNLAARPAIVLPDDRPFAIEPEPLAAEAIPSSTLAGRLQIRLVRPDGTPALGAALIVQRPTPLYLHDHRVWPGPTPLPAVPLPTVAIRDALFMAKLRDRGVRLPASLEAKMERIELRPRLKCWLEDPPRGSVGAATQFCAQLFAFSKNPRCTQVWQGYGGWQWTRDGIPPARRPEDPVLEFDLAAANTVGARFADFRLGWVDWLNAWSRPVTRDFPDEFVAWHASLPPGIEVDVHRDLQAFFEAPLRASVDFSALATDANHDWFDLTIALRVEDTTLTAAEIELLLKASGRWVRLPKKGWRRLDLNGLEANGPAAATLDRLGLTTEEVIASGKSATHRLHALQLASEANTLEARDAKLAAALRDRVAAIAAQPAPPLPAGLTATLRPYQREGFHFLAHLGALGFGGVLADDMGLGKTVQTLAWLLHLAHARAAASAKFRALVVCPKSVTHGWLSETARFTPALTAIAFTPAMAEQPLADLSVQILVVNYTQLRLQAEWLHSAPWDVVVLDEGQFIKNPTSQMAVAARALAARHRIVLTGTPVENRLSDLWSLFAFAQPGLLGSQASFRRQYDEKDPAALARLHRRVSHFLLRRTKAQAAPDLPPRTEDDLLVELEPAQRQLYDAELKRARAQLLGIETARALDQVRFNILASLLRLRQICCHPALIDPAHAGLPSAKLDALLERLEELRDEGHQVLVFSQFVAMLEIIRTRLAAAGIGHLVLTGQTENRAELVAEFQRDRSKTVFLLSLKAAGFGLNLTAASYAILYDPWWNPAVEAQAIDRTHRIGQTRPVFAYRLLAENTVEQKIRALQQEKAALAAAVVQEESLASVLDLESLRQILG